VERSTFDVVTSAVPAARRQQQQSGDAASVSQANMQDVSDNSTVVGSVEDGWIADEPGQRELGGATDAARHPEILATSVHYCLLQSCSSRGLAYPKRDAPTHEHTGAEAVQGGGMPVSLTGAPDP
jgi:hypothetical protein